jgi:hypothetical protein
MKSKIAVGNLGEEELARFKQIVLTRNLNRAQAETLFSHANQAKAQASRKIDGLFVQAKGAETMAPTLAKTARVFGEATPSLRHAATPDKVKMKEYRKYIDRKSHEGKTSWLKSIGIGAGVGAGAGGLYGALRGGGAGAGAGLLAGGLVGAAGGAILNASDRATINRSKKIRKTRSYDRALMDDVDTQVRMKEMGDDMKSDLRHREMMDAMNGRSKYSSVTENVDTFFKKLAEASKTEAQRRYPELLKASAAPGVGTRPSPATKRGPNMTASQPMSAGGAA